MRNPGRSAWQVDVAWAAALLAWVTAAAATVLAALAFATGPATGPTLQAVVLETVFAGGDAAPPAVARPAPTYDGRGPFELWPGTGVSVGEAELPGLTVGEARARLATAFADRRMADGAGWTASLADAPLATEFDVLERAVLAPLAEAELGRALLRLGLDDGTRAADWPTQAARNPGQPVQPLVGVFVTLPVDQVQGVGTRAVGERVVAGLAARLAEGGIEAARAAMGNAQLAAALEAALAGPVWQSWRAAMAAAWVARDEALGRRLTEAQATLEVTGRAVDPLADAWSGVDLEGATPEEARERTLVALAERAHAGGSAAVLAVLATPEARARVEAAGGWIDALDDRAQRRYATWAWVAGIVAALLLVIVALAQVGRARLLVPGLVLSLAAGPLAWAWWWWQARAEDAAAAAAQVPANALAVGLPGAARAWSGHLIAASAEASAAAVAYPVLAAAGLGAVLLLTTLLAAFWSVVRPRRRGRF